jgi:hypothetical protein
MLGVDDILTISGSVVSGLSLFTENGDWLLIVCGVDGLKSGRDRGVGGAFDFVTAALTVSAFTSAAAIFGAAMPNPRCPRLICFINLGCFDDEDEDEDTFVTAGSGSCCVEGDSFRGSGSGSFRFENMFGFSISAWFMESFLAEGTLLNNFFSGRDEPRTFKSSI